MNGYEDRFIPWAYVFADYSVSGLTASRCGYTAYKRVLSDVSQLIDTTYVDDFTRASRSELEWWKLAALSKRHQKRLIGASDGLDLSNPNSEIMITMYGLLSRLFVKSLREKVSRGMKGAARRGTCLGKPALGFARRPKLDSDGRPLVGADGQAIHEFCIDPATAALRLRMYELYVSENWSCGKIARHFNEIRADGGDSWTQSSVRKLLLSPTAIGVFLWNRTRREYDAELERWVVLRNPSSQWARHFDPELAIVPLKLWRAARRKLAHARQASPLTGRPLSRNELQPTTLFSGTLRCACCKEELKLVRSTSAHKQLGSLNGINKIHGCQLSTSKSTRIIEECLLEYLRDTLLTKEVVAELVERANRYLAVEAARPRINVAPLRQQVAALQKEIERYRKRIGKTDDDSLADGYEAEIRRLRQRQQGLNDQIRSATTEQSRDYSPISVDGAMTYLADLRSLLNSDIPIAGPLIRELTGPILIREERDAPRRRRSIWIASFHPQWNAVLRKLFPERNLGTCADTAETCPVQAPVEVPMRQRPQYERLAPEIQRLHARGSSISDIAVALEVNRNLVRAGLQFAEDGTRPPVVAVKRPPGPRRKRACFYIEIAPEIARLRDVEKLSIPKITKLKGIGVGTVSRAYNHAHRQAIKSAIEQGAKRPPAPYAHLSPAVFERIRELKAADMTAKQIAAEAGCSAATVRRELFRLQKSAAAPAGDDEPRAA